MKYNNILKFQIFSAVFSIILGTLLHFTYEWSGKNIIVSAFSSINESTWEHLKLVFFPMLISTIIGYFIFRHNKNNDNYISNFLCSKTIGIISAICFIVVFFYTYTGILGRNIAIVDILSFVVAVLLGEFVSYINIALRTKCNNFASIITLSTLLLCFILFTYYTPKIQLFQDPITGSYGLESHKLPNIT